MQGTAPIFNRRAVPPTHGLTGRLPHGLFPLMSRESEGEDDDLRAQADRRLADALEQTGLPDPRGRYRNWLRELRARDDAAFRKALEYFEQQLEIGRASCRERG